MYKNIYKLQRDYNKNMSLDFLFFWGHSQKNPDKIDQSCLSQWYPSEFIVDDILYNNAEQFMMAQKAELFGDSQTFALIMNASTPKEMKALGRKVKNFSDDIWNKNRAKIVERGNYNKFSQNQSIRKFLISTKDKILVEASPYDRIWGIGMSKDNSNIYNVNRWNGLNLLGFALMSVRDMIKIN